MSRKRLEWEKHNDGFKAVFGPFWAFLSYDAALRVYALWVNEDRHDDVDSQFRTFFDESNQADAEAHAERLIVSFIEDELARMTRVRAELAKYLPWRCSP